MASEQIVYSIIGEGGNSEVVYAPELDSLQAALDAIRTDDLPGCPFGRGGIERGETNVAFSVREPVCYKIIAHRPQSVVRSEIQGGIHQCPRTIYDLASGSVVTLRSEDDRTEWPKQRGVVQEADLSHAESIPAEWSAFCRRLIAVRKPQANVAVDYKAALAGE